MTSTIVTEYGCKLPHLPALAARCALHHLELRCGPAAGWPCDMQEDIPERAAGGSCCGIVLRSAGPEHMQASVVCGTDLAKRGGRQHFVDTFLVF